MKDHTENQLALHMVVVPQDFLDGLIDEVKEIKTVLRQKSDEEIKSQWVDSVEARRMLGVSQKTWQTYRDQRRIPFSQHGRKIYVKRADLEAFMESHYIKAK